MKLIRHGIPGKELPGILHEGKKWDTSRWFDDYGESFFENEGISKLSQLLKDNFSEMTLLSDDVRLGPPVGRPSKIVCVGLNYRDHAIETNSTIPTQPILFFKSTTALCGPDDDLIIPLNSNKTDWEIELAVVIGKKASYVPIDRAMEYVAGYCMMNDYSERAFQKEMGGQFCKGKSCDTFAPLGPWLVTKDEIEDVHNLKMQLMVNGKTYQNGNSADMIFSVGQLVSYISQFMTLLPGDIISTGTPAGVGAGVKPHPVFLHEGDTIEMYIESLGRSSQKAKGLTMKG